MKPYTDDPLRHTIIINMDAIHKRCTTVVLRSNVLLVSSLAVSCAHSRAPWFQHVVERNINDSLL
jgi:hypothetical protein